MNINDVASGSAVKIHASINKHNVVLMTEAVFGVNSGLLVRPMEYFGRYMQLMEPSQVQINNKRDGRVYKFMSTTITPVKTRYGTFHLIRCSSALEPENSRKAERFFIEKLGIFRINGNSSTMKNCIVYDLSMRGMSLIVDNASRCKIGDTVDVTFRYGNIPHDYEISATIVRMFAVQNKPAIGCSISNMNVDLIGLLNNKKHEKYGEPAVEEQAVTAAPAPSNLNPAIPKKQQIMEVEEDIAKQLIPEKSSPKRKLNAKPLSPENLEHLHRSESDNYRRHREHLMAEQAKAIENLLDSNDV